MRPDVAHRRIESFAKRFGEAHLHLCYHGAFPLALTPDLLYCLWHNFKRDIHGQVLEIPWVAVADLLLSPLCEEVGEELYEMDAAVRNLLLARLKEDSRFGEKRINELSEFLLAYVQQQQRSHDPDVRDFAEAQKWTALAYARPSEAARELALALKKAYQEDKTELVRVASMVETFAEPLAGFEPLLVYARGMGDFARGELEGATDKLLKLEIPQKLSYFSRGLRVIGAVLSYFQFGQLFLRDSLGGRRRKVEVAGVSLDIPQVIFEPKTHFSRQGTKITDAKILKDTLRDLGFTVKTNAKVRGRNQRRKRADVVAVLEGECDLGWQRNSDGSFDMIADLWGVDDRYNKIELINSINQLYASKLRKEIARIRELLDRNILDINSHIFSTNKRFQDIVEKLLKSDHMLVIAKKFNYQSVDNLLAACASRKSRIESVELEIQELIRREFFKLKNSYSYSRTLRTKIFHAEILKTALRDLGIDVQTEVDIRGYGRQQIRGDIVAVLEGEFDIGWIRNTDGSFDMIADLWGVAKKHNQTELIAAINQSYLSHFRENIARGQELLEEELGADEFEELLESEPMQTVVKEYNYHSVNDLLAALGYGGVTLNRVVTRLREAIKADRTEEL